MYIHHFTFQYGSINTADFIDFAEGCQIFTFQYGSINTETVKEIPDEFKNLYIPIWFY